MVPSSMKDEIKQILSTIIYNFYRSAFKASPERAVSQRLSFLFRLKHIHYTEAGLGAEAQMCDFKCDQLWIRFPQRKEIFNIIISSFLC